MIVLSTALRYILSGIIASAVMFGALVFFREVLGVWYLYSSTLAFVLAFCTSFLLQKLWTFKAPGGPDARKQLLLFFAVSVLNLGINAAGMFVLVDMVGVWYLLSQAAVTAGIAAWSFFAYRAIFRPCAE